MNIDKRIEKLEKELQEIKTDIRIHSVNYIAGKVTLLKQSLEKANLKPVGIVLSSNMYEILQNDCKRQIGIGDISYVEKITNTKRYFYIRYGKFRGNN